VSLIATRRLRLLADRRAPSAVRTAIRDVLDETDLTDLADDVMLLASELVTNAVLHAAAPSQVRLRLREGRVRLEVHDPSPQVPVPRARDLGATNGRGMVLVDALADAWGVEVGDGLPDVGKTVWVELALHP